MESIVLDIYGDQPVKESWHHVATYLGGEDGEMRHDPLVEHLPAKLMSTIDG